MPLRKKYDKLMKGVCKSLERTRFFHLITRGRSMDSFMDKLAQKFTAGEVIRANQTAEENELYRLRTQVEEYEKCLQEMRKLQLGQNENGEKLSKLVTACEEKVQQILKTDEEKEEDALAPALLQAFEQQREATKQELDSVKSQNVRTAMELSTVQEQAGKTLDRLATLQTTTEENMQRLLQMGESQAAAVNALKQQSAAQNSLLTSLQQGGDGEDSPELEAIFALSDKQDDLLDQSNEFIHSENVKVYRNIQTLVTEELTKQTQDIQKTVTAELSRLSDEMLEVEHELKDASKPRTSPLLILTLVISLLNLLVLMLHVLEVL